MTATKYCKGPTRKGYARPKIGLKAKWRMLGASRLPAVARWRKHEKASKADDSRDISRRYEAVNAMLLNEFLKEHRKVEQQQATIGRLETTAAKQETNIAEL